MKHAQMCFSRILVACACLAAALTLTTSCDDSTYDHTPPAGQGSIIIDNGSGSDAEVFLGGVFAGIAESGEATVFDLEPGVYRLVLAEEDGDRNYWNDVDVIANRLTILDVMIDYSSASLYHVVIDFEQP